MILSPSSVERQQRRGLWVGHFYFYYQRWYFIFISHADSDYHAHGNLKGAWGALV